MQGKAQGGGRAINGALTLTLTLMPSCPHALMLAQTSRGNPKPLTTVYGQLLQLLSQRLLCNAPIRVPRVCNQNRRHDDADEAERTVGKKHAAVASHANALALSPLVKGKGGSHALRQSERTERGSKLQSTVVGSEISQPVQLAGN